MRRKVKVSKHTVFLSIFSITVLLAVGNGETAFSKEDDTITCETSCTNESNSSNSLNVSFLDDEFGSYNVLDDNEVLSELLRDDWASVQFLFANKETELTDKKSIDQFYNVFKSNLKIQTEVEEKDNEVGYATPFYMIIKTNSGKRYNIDISGLKLTVNGKCYLIEDGGKILSEMASYF